MSRRLIASTIVAGLIATGCSDRPAPAAPRPFRHAVVADLSQPQPVRYIILFTAERIATDFPERVAALGGSVETSLDSIGVAAVIGLTDTAAAQLATAPDVKAVEPDAIIGISAEQVEAADPAADLAPSAPLASLETSTSPTSAQFYPRQWNMRAIFADQAWAAGQTGSRDVVVAVLDAGIDYLHPDLVGLVDLVRSKSFAPEEDVEVAARFPGRLAISDLNYHGTAIASIIASNGKVVAGINQNVTLLAVKIWNRSLVGPASRLLAGLVYAADQGADVINVSGEYRRDKSDSGGVAAAFNRATNYAFRKGALLVSVAGNDTTDLDHDGDRVRFPCQSPHAICASGTGPTAADGINGPWHDVDARAPYSAYGRSAIDVAAPSGAGEVGQFRRVWVPCTTTPTETTPAPACRAHQPVAQASGTSFAAPHVAGLAALLVAQLGHGNPALIRAHILQSADDLGEPGTDPYYGKGRINVARALGLIP
jgi:subtilisin family serine protease